MNKAALIELIQGHTSNLYEHLLQVVQRQDEEGEVIPSSNRPAFIAQVMMDTLNDIGPDLYGRPPVGDKFSIRRN